MLQPN